MRLALALVILLVSTALAGGQTGRRAALDYLASKDVAAPRVGRLVVCHEFDCAKRTDIEFSRQDIDEIRRLFAGIVSAPQERLALARAIALLERKVAPAAGTGRDRGGLDPLTPEPGQLDCIDETVNTTQYLVMLADLGLVRLHAPAGPAARGFLLDLRYPHQTAVMIDNTTGRAWAVDSWPRANGLRPDIVPLDAWREAERRFR